MNAALDRAACLNVARRLAWPLALTLAALAGKSALGENEPVLGGDSPAPASAAARPAERLREGSKLTDVVGTFQFSGDRVAFSPDGTNDSLRVLENLALERISRLLTEGRSGRTWVVSGTITEFRGSNYLLVTKAAIKLDASRPTAP